MAINITTKELSSLKISAEKMAALIEQLKTLEVEFDKIAQGSPGSSDIDPVALITDILKDNVQIDVNGVKEKANNEQIGQISLIVIPNMVKQAEDRLTQKKNNQKKNKLLGKLKEYLGTDFYPSAYQNKSIQYLSTEVKALEAQREVAAAKRSTGTGGGYFGSPKGVQSVTEESAAEEREELLSILEDIGHQRGEFLGLSNEDLHEVVREKTLAEIMKLNVTGVTRKTLGGVETKVLHAQLKLLKEYDPTVRTAASDVVEEGKDGASKAEQGKENQKPSASDGNTPKAAGG